jgi:threonyl-tRNA synthetase
LPLWINPQQIRLLPVSEKTVEACQNLQKQFLEAGFACDLDARNEKIGYKIREGEKDKVPYLLIVGEKEVTSGQVSVRKRKKGDLGPIPLEMALEKLKLEVLSKGKTPFGGEE